VYGAKATRSTLSTFNKVDRVEFNFVAVCTGLKETMPHVIDRIFYLYAKIGIKAGKSWENANYLTTQ